MNVGIIYNNRQWFMVRKISAVGLFLLVCLVHTSAFLVVFESFSTIKPNVSNIVKTDFPFRKNR